MKTYFILLISVTIINVANAQIISSSNAVKGSINDAMKLTEAYLNPFEKSIGSIGSNGFVSFTKNSKKISYNIGANISSTFTPKADRTYNVNTLGLQEIKASDPNNSIAQSFSGNETSIKLETTQTYTTIENSGGIWGVPSYVEKPISTFNSPKGSGSSYLTLPLLYAGIHGYGTSINFRILPKFKVADNNGDIFSYGASIQHNLKQFITVLEKLPVDISILAGFQITNFNYYLDVKPDESRFAIKLQDNGPYTNQVLEINTFSVPLQLIISKSIKAFNIYSSLGYNIIRSDVALIGNFPLYYTDPTNTAQILVEDISNPFSYSHNNNQFRLDFGLQYQISIVKINANYSFANYNAFSFGLGINF